MSAKYTKQILNQTSPNQGDFQSDYDQKNFATQQLKLKLNEKDFLFNEKNYSLLYYGQKQSSSVKHIGSTMPILSQEFADDAINIEKSRNILQNLSLIHI
eukprot:TRINITY_DN11135_c0_g1_i2.p4 TRINITY_DN11135_c0_g1~~TRINITY_DN11135_c0_g1_i2.p4  ORF type:complete len:100 (-),score=17.03 TRINITY_DN11135_c0_g1_i2:123-422(-)